MSEFTHLHNHTQFSILDGASGIPAMLDKAVRDGMNGAAITDHGNMFGTFQFINESNKRGLKPIVGCEFYLVKDRKKQSFLKSKGERDVRNHQLLLAKNMEGYQNLVKLCSLGYMEGLYGKFPRIDKELLEKYSKGLIATSCCIAAEIPQAIIHGDLELAEERLQWWVERFGDDFYIELQRHRGLENITYRNEYGRTIDSGYSQEDVNQILLGWAKKYNLKVIATNDAHYVEEEDWLSHDILLCLNTNAKLSEPKGDGKGERFGFPSTDFYFKTQQEMKNLFHDIPAAIENTQDIFHKIEPINLMRDVLLPKFPVPSDFPDENAYLRHLTYEGALRRYGEISEKVRERLDFELGVIKESGYPGYFLIVQDFTSTAREMDVWVGPGRGSAAGSAVAYCLGITNVDPIKYDLLFERFLNPERISMPDIDIDFDDLGRQKVLDYVVEKYGQNQVAQIVTYGTMAAKSSVRNVARVLDLPLDDADTLAKSIPDGISLNQIFKEELPALKEKLRNEDYQNVIKLREAYDNNDNLGPVLKNAMDLEGSIRNTGIHACAVVITPEDITGIVPVLKTKGNDLLISQYDNDVAESAGLLKMDFLGLRTLTIIKDAVEYVNRRHNINLSPETMPEGDEKTFELFQKGETVGIFQFESDGMQKYLRELKPSKFEDLVAMNALYRPGPMDHIPEYVRRKHGQEAITYDLPEMEDILKETYGITVFQEQVMLLSQRLASFTRGQADYLRKGMGKKRKEIIDELFPLFIENGTANGHPKDILEKIWKDWEAFASYAFNKSHSVCYAELAYQSAYLKANYGPEFMASVLSNNRHDVTKLNTFLAECKRMGIKLVRPSVNDSEHNFSVNADNDLVIGLSGLKGIGDGPIEAIIEERRKDGKFQDIYEFMRRNSMRQVNKKVMNSLVLSGAMDDFGFHRSQFVTPYLDSYEEETFIERLLKYGASFDEDNASGMQSLFGGMEESLATKPEPPDIDEFNLLDKLEREKDIVSLYVSGHPLDDYELEYRLATNAYLSDYEDLKEVEKVLCFGGFITECREIITKRGDKMGRFNIQDFNGSQEFILFGEQYLKYQHLLIKGNTIAITGEFYFHQYSDSHRFKIMDIKLISELGAEKLKGISLDVPIDRVDDDLINRLHKICQNAPGEHSLQLVLHENGDDKAIHLESRSLKVKVDMDFLNAVRKLDLKFRLN